MNEQTFMYEQLAAFEEIVGGAREAANNPDIPVGTPVYSGSMDGADGKVPIREVKSQTLGGTTLGEWQAGGQPMALNTRDGKPLPERIPVYHRLRNNDVSWVPTGTWQEQIAKLGPDNKPVYSLRPWPGVEERVASDLTCDICLRMSGGKVRKRFYDDQEGDPETKWEGHMRAYHQNQFETILRRRQEDERRAERELLLGVLNRFADRMDTLTPAEAEAVRQARERYDETAASGAAPAAPAPEAAPSFPCECGYEARSEGGLRLHRMKAKIHQEA